MYQQQEIHQRYIYKELCMGGSKAKIVLYFPYSTMRYEQCYVLLKALPRVCMENTAQGGVSRVNTAQGKAECCIYLETRPRVLYFSYK